MFSPALPFPIPAGQEAIFIPPTSFSAGGEVLNGDCFGTGAWQRLASGSVTGGNIFVSGSHSLGITNTWIMWSGFSLPDTFPTGVTISGIYPVVIVSAGNASCGSQTVYGGQNLQPTVNSGSLGTNIALGPFGPYSGQFSFSSGQSIGNTVTDITEADIAAVVARSECGPCSAAGFANFVYVGLAVYLTFPPGLLQPVISVSVGNTRSYP